MSLPHALLFALALALAACQASPYDIDRESAAHHLTLAEADILAGRQEDAFERLQAIWAVPSLQPELRVEVERLLGEANPDPDDLSGDELVDLAELELPRRLRIELWVDAARALLAEGERMESFRELQDLERTYPLHQLGNEAAEIIAQAGTSFARDDGHYLLLFPYRAKAHEVLEFLVLTYPSSPRCPQAYIELARLYEEDGDWMRAIERHQELLQYHLDSPHATESELRIPYLRLLRVQNPEYDRSEVETCLDEIETWLERHPGHELEGWANELLADTRRRLVDHALSVARFYEKIANPYGARRNADRALAEANALGDAQRVAMCANLLARLPEDSAALDPSRVQGPALDDPVDSDFGAGLGVEDGP